MGVWADAFTTLQPALNAAGSGDQIWVAEGTYKPTVEHGGSGDRYRSFQMKNGVAIYGGFDPTLGYDTWEERDWVNRVAILSGDIGIAGDSSDNSYHVFYHRDITNLDSTAILDGFTITRGNADGYWPHNRGGGMYNYELSPAVSHCTFKDNRAEWGGGMLNDMLSSPTLTGCTFSHNMAFSIGGGMYNDQVSSPTLTDCTFSANTALTAGGMGNNGSSPVLTGCEFLDNVASTAMGGGMTNDRSSPVLIDCRFLRNSASTWAGALYNYKSSPTLTGCMISANSANDGGGIYNFDSSPRLTDCGLTVNEAVQNGGGIYNENSSPTLIDSGVAFNSAQEGGGIYNANGSSPSLIGCYVSINSAQRGGGMLNDASSPTLTSSTFMGNLSDWGAGMANVNGSAPFLSYCTFADNSADYSGGGVFNEGSSPTLNNCTFSTNSAGVRGGGMFNYLSSSPALAHSTFSDNEADEGGGMANLDHSAPTLDDCTFADNSAGDGGGMFNENDSSPTLTNCTFDHNFAFVGGGMLNTDSSSPMVTSCTFAENVAALRGGGMVNHTFSSPTVINSTFWENSAGDSNGGGMYNYNYSSPTVTNCTFWYNWADRDGGAIYNGEYSSPRVTNCILWGDVPDEIYNVNSTPVVTYSDVEGGYGDWTNIDQDPLFLDLGSRDFHLKPSSPCVDMGQNTAPAIPAYDFEGDPRILDGDRDGSAIVDMGVDELGKGLYLPLVLSNYSPAITVVLYNDEDGDGIDAGDLLSDPHTVEVSGIGAFTTGDTINVAFGQTVNYRLRRGGVVGPWQQATFPDDLATNGQWQLEFATVSVVLYNADDLLADPHTVEVSNVGQFVTGDTFHVPPGATISYSLRRGGIVAPWQWTQFAAGDYEWRLEFATVSVVLYNADDLLADPHTVEVSNVGQFVTGDTFHVPPGVNISFRFRRGGIVGPWQATQFAAGDYEWRLEFATVQIGICVISNPPQVEVSNVGIFDLLDIMHVPPDANISFRLIESGSAGPWMLAQFAAGETIWDLEGAVDWSECYSAIIIEKQTDPDGAAESFDPSASGTFANEFIDDCEMTAGDGVADEVCGMISKRHPGDKGRSTLSAPI